VDKLHQLFALQDDASFRLNMQYFNFSQINRMYTDELISLIGFSPRIPESELKQKHMDLAKSLQVILILMI
jgi:carbamoyltransferase